MFRHLVAVFVVLLLAGCATQRISFPEAEYVGLHLSGDKSLKGSVFLIDQLEEKQIGAGSEVTLEPVTSYSDQWFEVCYLQDKSIRKPDQRYNRYVMRTVADDEGGFLFSGVAPGEYLLTGHQFWSAVNCSAKVMKTEVLVSMKIVIKEDTTVLEIPLTKDYESPVIICDLYTQGDWEVDGDLF